MPRDGWLTDADFRRVGIDALRRAEAALRDGSTEHRFHASTDYDMVLADGTRLVLAAQIASELAGDAVGWTC